MRVNNMPKQIIYIFLISICLLLSCQVQTESTELKFFPIKDLNGIVAQSGIVLDDSVSADSNSSIKIDASKPVVINLFNVIDVRVEDTQLIYKAKVKSENLKGQAYLEMWCVFKDKGEYFSRGFDSIITGTTDWKDLKTVFNLRKNEMPDVIKLNVVVDGIGTLWIDDIHLTKL